MITITARKGFRFTQQRDVDIESRIVVKTLYLSELDSTNSWKEISESEAAEILSRQQAIMDERARQNNGSGASIADNQAI